jgi:hypothetical protein
MTAWQDAATEVGNQDLRTGNVEVAVNQALGISDNGGDGQVAAEGSKTNE